MSKHIHPQALTAAIATAEPAVPTTTSVPGSIKSQVDALARGEHFAKAWKIAPHNTFEAWAADSANQRQRLRNSLTSSIAQARERTRGTYTTEVGDMLLGGNLYIVAIVTRID